VCAVGIQGSGKSTHLKRYDAANGNSVYISIGDIVREDRKLDSNSGKLVDDDTINGIFDNQIGNLSQNNRPEVVLLDGYPRSIPQFEHLKSSELIDSTFPVIFAIFEPLENVVRQRLLKRKRADDTPELIEQRILEFDTTTVPMIDRVCQDYPMIFKFDTGGDKEQVSAMFFTYVNLHLRQIREMQPV